ncbi:MAG TPA: DUF4349 domain-containing protein, partial [Micromonosporaceae bacterium]|nr:DUF4349 domain-containing protein [Micromonosporaceae bacterium]
MFGTRRWRLAAGLGIAGLTAAAALAGCSAGSETAGSTAGNAADQAQKAVPGAAEAQPPGAGKDVPADLRIDQRSIIYTGSIMVRVDDVDREAARAVSIATAAGGFVGGDQRSRGEGQEQEQAMLELRIPADRFTAAV